MSPGRILLPILLFGVLIFLVVRNQDDGAFGGMARVVDGATIVIDGKRVQLAGLRELPLRQMCPGATETESWPCGRDAFIALSKLIDQGRVDCEPASEPVGGVLTASCRAGGMDLALAAVAAGWGVAGPDASGELRRAEAQAKEQRKGVWR